NEARAVIERGMKAFNAHDMEAIARDVAPGGEYHAPGDIKLKGSQQIKEYNQNFVTAFPDARVEAKNIFTQGNHVTVEGVFTGTHNGTLKTPMGDVPATGKKVSGEYIQIFDVDRGLVKKVHMVYDQVELIYAFEENTGLEIPDEDAEKITTVGQAWEYIQEKAGS